MPVCCRNMSAAKCYNISLSIQDEIKHSSEIAILRTGRILIIVQCNYGGCAFGRDVVFVWQYRD
jgi:hypothetical protein